MRRDADAVRREEVQLFFEEVRHLDRVHQPGTRVQEAVVVADRREEQPALQVEARVDLVVDEETLDVDFDLGRAASPGLEVDFAQERHRLGHVGEDDEVGARDAEPSIRVHGVGVGPEGSNFCAAVGSTVPPPTAPKTKSPKPEKRRVCA